MRVGAPTYRRLSSMSYIGESSNGKTAVSKTVPKGYRCSSRRSPAKYSAYESVKEPQLVAARSAERLLAVRAIVDLSLKIK